MKKRYIIGICLLLLVLITAGVFNLRPVRPFIQLPGEAYPYTAEEGLFAPIGGFLNTFMASVLAYIILFSLPAIVKPEAHKPDEVPSGFYNFFEWLVESLYSFVEGITGREKAKEFFPYFSTFLMLVLTVNLMALIPGYDSIGLWEYKPHFYEFREAQAAEAEGMAVFEELHANNQAIEGLRAAAVEEITVPELQQAVLEVDTVSEVQQLIINDQMAGNLEPKYLSTALSHAGDGHGEEVNDHGGEETADDHSEETADESHTAPVSASALASHEFFETLAHEYYVQIDNKNVGDLQNGILLMEADEGNEEADWTIVPFVRPAASDLTFTLALALISMTYVQIVGFRYLGADYLKKFFVSPRGFVDTFAEDPIQGIIKGVINPAVGLIELVSEFAKIISFAFRLLGAVFGGMVLLFVMSNLAAVANMAFFGLEMFVGSIQAFVFAMLSLIFINGATEAHHGDDHDHH